MFGKSLLDPKSIFKNKLKNDDADKKVKKPFASNKGKGKPTTGTGKHF